MNLKDAITSDRQQAEWRMKDSMKRLRSVAETIAKRGAEGVAMMDAAIEGKPTSMSWVSFGVADINRAQEELARLSEQIALFNHMNNLLAMCGE